MAFLDTHLIIKELVATGTSEEAAEVFVKRFVARDEISSFKNDLATKTDIQELRSDIKNINTNLKWLMAIVLTLVGILLKNTFI